MATDSEKHGITDVEIDATKLDHGEDIAEVTTKNPYTEVNFIGTYVAIILGAVASYGGYVMPITSLAFINEDLGMLHAARISVDTRSNLLQGLRSTSPGCRSCGRFALPLGALYPSE